jgi:ubiquinone/menaquinone biosynthesis C-methylase UbiE
MDILNLDLGSDSQSNLICIHVLKHLPNYEVALLELLRVVREKMYIASWFNQGSEDLNQFSQPSERWDKQRFYNNRYSLTKSLSFIYHRSEKAIEDIRIHHFEGDNYGIALAFKPRVGEIHQ